jgi:hypothetical protein
MDGLPATKHARYRVSTPRWVASRAAPSCCVAVTSCLGAARARHPWCACAASTSDCRSGSRVRAGRSGRLGGVGCGACWSLAQPDVRVARRDAPRAGPPRPAARTGQASEPRLRYYGDALTLPALAGRYCDHLERHRLLGAGLHGGRGGDCAPHTRLVS